MEDNNPSHSNLRSRERVGRESGRDHGEDQHAEQNHPGHLTCYWSLPSSRGLYRERVMLFTNKSPLKPYYYYAIFHMKKKQTHTQIYKQESFENLLLLCSITK